MATIRLRTEIPGPRTREMLARREEFIPRGISAATPLFVQRAEGALFEDIDGNRFIDFAGGIGVLNAGHCPPAVVDAVREQAGQCLHTCFMVVGYEGYVNLASDLCRLSPGSGPRKAMFVNSGAEAVENGVKIARKYTGRPAVVCFSDAFHGRTLLTMTMTYNLNPYKDGFGPFAPEVHGLPYAYCYRCPYERSHPECDLYCLTALEEMLQARVGAHNVAALVVEPVQGEGGVITPPPGFLPGLQDLCRRHGIVFIVDEVQTGFGRTGRLFASEHEGLDPDLLLVAKSIAAGLPLAGVIGKTPIMDSVHRGGIGGTYGGNPLACAAALEVIRQVNEPQFLARARQIGDRLVAFCHRLQAGNAAIGDVRGLGCMVAMELIEDRRSRKPAARVAAEVVDYAWRHGLIVLKTGRLGNVLRFLPPLVTTDDQLDEALKVLTTAIGTATAQRDRVPGDQSSGIRR